MVNRNYGFQFPDGSTHHLMVQESDKVGKILEELCNAVKLTKRQNFALEMTMPDGSSM